MPTMMNGRVPEAEPVAPAPTLDEPMCLFAALVDGLTNSERYTIVARNGELFVTPVHPRSQPRSLRRAA